MANRQVRWNAVFDLYDLDGDDHLTKADVEISFARLMEAKGIDNGSDAAKELHAGTNHIMDALMAADIDGDGKVTRKEWLSWYERELGRGEGYFTPSPELLEFAHIGFGGFDVDADGRFSEADYLACSRVLNVKSDEAALRSNWEALCARYGGKGRSMTFYQYLAAFVDMWCREGDTPFWFPIAS